MATENVPVFSKYEGNGAATEFSIGFPYLDTEFVKVYIKRNGEEEEKLDSNRFSFVNDTTVKFPVLETDTVLQEGEVITIQRETTLGSEYEFDNQVRLFPEEVMNADDLSFQQIQELARDLERAVKVKPTDEKTSDELIDEVYNNLKTATETAAMAIESANQAQTAADNATEAVRSAEQTLVGTHAYVAQAKAEIEGTKNTAISTIDNTVSNAKGEIANTIVSAKADITNTADNATSDITNTVTQAKADINASIDEAAMNISDIVSNAEGSITNIAVTEANKVIANAAQEATDIATANVNNYVDGTVKPSLQTYVDQAQADANSAAISMEQAALSATAASEYASNASADADNAAESATHAATSAEDSEHYSEDSRIWAEGSDNEVQGLGGVHSSKVWSEIVEGAITTIEGAVGDIGFAPLGIDETQNKRRYLNGQVISQSQFGTFTDKVKAAVALYPSLSATEENWQAEVTNSKLGQCGKFVIDDTAGTIRLPKVVNINGLQDLANIGKIKAESLPNITGNAGAAGAVAWQQGTDAFRTQGGTARTAAYDATSTPLPTQLNFDASRSSSTYQDGAPVQQEAVQYPYFIQVATGSEESVDVTREIQLNNPFSLLDYKWSEYEITNASWLISNGSFHSGATYVSVYELLLKIKNGTETKDGVSVKLSTEAYTDTDFVINTADTTFRLPVKVKLASGSAVAGNGMGLGLTDGENNGGIISNTLGLLAIKAAYGLNAGTAPGNSSNMSTNAVIGVTTDQTKSGIETSSSGLKLYFYVGETIQDANIIDAANLINDVYNLDSAAVHKDLDEVITGWKDFRNSNNPITIFQTDIIDSSTAHSGSSTKYSGIEIQDKNGIRIGKFEVGHSASNVILASLSVGRKINGEMKYKNITVDLDSSGNGWVENLRPNYGSLVGLGMEVGKQTVMPNDGVLIIAATATGQSNPEIKIFDGSGHQIGVIGHHGGSSEYNRCTFTTIVARGQAINCTKGGTGTAVINFSYLAPWR